MNKLLTFGEIVLLLFISTIVVLIMNLGVVYRYVLDDYIQFDFVNDNSLFIRLVDATTEIKSIIFTPSIATFVVWFVIGFIAYVAVGLFASGANSLKDVFLTGTVYKHPENFRYSKYWFGFLAGLVELVAILLLFMFWVFLTLTYFVPFSTASFYVAALGDDVIAMRVVYIASSLIGIFIGLIGFVTLYRILKARRIRY